MNNIYISHSPFHSYLSGLIASTYYPKDKNLLVTEGNHKIKRNIFHEIIELKSTGGSVLKSRASIEESLKTIISLATTPSRIFISDIAWPLCNRVFFSKELNTNSFYFFSDGIGSYINAQKNKKQIIRDSAKVITGTLGLTSRYRNFTGHHLGYDQKKTKGIFIPNASSIKETNLTITNIVLPPPQTFPNQKSLLFLDQPLWSILGKSWEEKFDYTIKRMKENYKDYTLYFKQHHRSRNIEKQKLLDLGYLELDRNYCIEEIAEEKQFNVVISFYSSALLHLKLLIADIEIISLRDKDIEKALPNTVNVIDIFSNHKIPSVELKDF
ncbi:alpha-2,8-polysialyltransferase family protein [Pseudomonas nitroreducens]|uniref:polysialyltransferase family glycosyltransferase n=1 Tax=Pseudomonas nitroreducens TaxID=46680 RepID=UPI001474AB8D|nr:polysialyltransferase family glycosyltransferase [Pseudomonas nitroreducens]MDG9857158.1 alpha-2,8-polysialyltransferase family protein [Pseudomonas nitroreducens]MDH1074303.1 alpha-2,8-polysialyltransferase family protein [Pseudomonas nitroreducens]NMZ72916.1 hypothetical protein [Pseudomonas nitroreducens]